MNPATANLKAHVSQDLDEAPLVAGELSSGAGSFPNHIGIIMDGNGRWAKRHGLPRVEGHRKGVEALRRTVRNIGDRRIANLTLFAFSSENWKRPAAEVSDLMMLLRLFIKRDLAELRDNGVRVRVIGERRDLESDILNLLDEAETVTRHGTNMRLNIAFNYGARNEIVRAAQKLAEDVAQGRLDPTDITEDSFGQALDTAGLPDPDLIIRTSGELRLSNFLLWQAASSEFVFSDTLWPDFDGVALDNALAQFSTRQRRFGAR